MKFTDIFIKRPILSCVVSLLILIFGIAAFFKMPLRQFPDLSNTTITVITTYPGANADLVKGFITTPLSQAIGSADGIDYMTSTSTAGLSTITVYVQLGYDPNAALTNVTAAVNSVSGQLPSTVKPVIKKLTGDTFPVMFLGFSSETMNPEQISAYLSNVITPKVYSVGGISQIQLWGGQTYAMRIWLDQKLMNALGVTAADVNNALLNNSYISTPGQLEGKYDLLNLQVNTDLHNPEQFNNLVVKTVGSHLIRLKDVGKAKLGSTTYSTGATLNGKPAVFLTVQLAPGANPLTVIDNIRSLLPELEKNFPSDLKANVTYDATTYVRTAIKEVITTILEAAAIVIVVIFLFLGSLRAVLIPVVTIPLSLIGVCFLMYLMGFSLNLLTLLAMVLAIGLVVDDAIVVLENIYRYMEEGMSPRDAALRGARQIAIPVIVMTMTLAAVYAPIAFVGGVTGALFIEFAFTLAAAVIISGIIALTFSPMMTSKILDHRVLEKPLTKRIDRFFSSLQAKYQRLLHGVLEARSAVLFVVILILVSCYFMFTMIPSQLAPQEDQGSLKVAANAPVTATLNYLEKYGKQMSALMNKVPEKQDTFLIYGFPAANIVLGGLNLKSWDERTRSEMQIKPQLQKAMSVVPGVQAKVFEMPSLPGTPYGPPVNFVLKTSGDYQQLYDVMQELIDKANKSGLFMVALNSLQYNNPQIQITIDRAKAANLGIDMTAIGSALSTVLGEGYVNYFSIYGYAYEVIPQATRDTRYNMEAIRNIRIATRSGATVPLSSIVSMKYTTQPSQLDQFQQLNSDTFQGVLMPGVTLSQALTFLQTTAQTLLPQGMSYDYGGASRQYMEEGSALMYAFAFAVLIIFLFLAAQFESFRDPLIILIAVPMSIFGALLPLFLGAGTINIYSQIGLITLVGLITKHGILMVDFANELQYSEKLSVRDAIEKAAAIRLRPILMTTAAMVFGVVPLVIATGAGAVGRNDIGIVIAAGMLLGTCFTLFVVPTIYTYVSKSKN